MYVPSQHLCRLTLPRPVVLIAIFLLLFTALLAPNKVQADASQWVSIGPDGGIINTLAVAPSSTQIVYAGTTNGGVFKSTNSGISWHAANRGYIQDTCKNGIRVKNSKKQYNLACYAESPCVKLLSGKVYLGDSFPMS